MKSARQVREELGLPPLTRKQQAENLCNNIGDCRELFEILRDEAEGIVDSRDVCQAGCENGTVAGRFYAWVYDRWYLVCSDRCRDTIEQGTTPGVVPDAEED